jgi:hypothetical protein
MKAFAKLINQRGYVIQHIDKLTRLMNEVGSDKGLGLAGRHGYTKHYYKLLASRQNDPITFVEIGLLRADKDGRRSCNSAEGSEPLKATTAPSLEAWRGFLPAAKIVGFDIDDFSAVQIPGVIILQGDMSKASDLTLIAENCKEGIDVIIDDGSHASPHQQLAFSILFPMVKPGGVYCIEDCHWQDPDFEMPDVLPTRSVFQRWRSQRVLSSKYLDEARSREFAQWISKVEFHDSLEPDQPDNEDALCIIHKSIHCGVPTTLD